MFWKRPLITIIRNGVSGINICMFIIYWSAIFHACMCSTEDFRVGWGSIKYRVNKQRKSWLNKNDKGLNGMHPNHCLTSPPYRSTRHIKEQDNLQLTIYKLHKHSHFSYIHVYSSFTQQTPIIITNHITSLITILHSHTTFILTHF